MSQVGYYPSWRSWREMLYCFGGGAGVVFLAAGAGVAPGAGVAAFLVTGVAAFLVAGAAVVAGASG